MAFRDWLADYRKSQGISVATSTNSPVATVSSNSVTQKQASSTPNFSRLLKEYRNKEATGSAQGWAQQVNNLISDVNQHYSKWNNDNDRYAGFQNRAADLLALADSWRKQYGNDAEAVAAIDSVAEALNNVENYTRTYHGHYAQWDSEEAYNAAKGQENSSTASEERTWFQKGAFEDGYQFGDLTKTIQATSTDMREHFYAGILGLGEKALDALMYLAPYAAEAQFNQSGGYYNLTNANAFKQQNASAKQIAEDFIAQDLYDEEAAAQAITSKPLKELTGIDTETISVLGEKSDSLIQSGGQLAATTGLQAVGIPWWVTSGVTSFGSESENALNQGASFEEAGLSATITAGAEILTEKISGGIKFGNMGTLDDAAAKWLAETISNKALRYTAKLGLDAVGEGSEEVLSGAIGKFGQWLTYQDDVALEELLLSEEALDETLESFLGGIFLGSFGNTTQAVRSSVQNSFQHDTAIPNPNIQAIEQAQKNAVPGGTTVTVSSGSPVITEKSKQNSTLAYKLASNLDTVRDMDPVTALTGQEFNNRNIKLSDQIADFFRSLGSKVVRTGFGDVHLGEYGVGGMINHRPLNRAKMVSLAAAPDVIQDGRQISYEPNWKNRGYESYIFAAPVAVNGVTVYVAAVVDKRPNNKFYLSEMVDLNGNYVRIEESPSGNAKNGVTDGASITDRSGITARPEGLSEGGKPSATNAEPTPLFGNIISQAVQNVNPATIQQQLENPTNPLADPEVQRQLLAFTDRASLTDGQQLALDVFKRRMGEIASLQAQLQEQQSILARKQANGVRPVDQNDTKNRIALLKTMLTREQNELLSMQSAPGLQQILEKINATRLAKQRGEKQDFLQAFKLNSDYRKPSGDFDIDRAKSDYSTFLTSAPEKHRMYLQQSLDSVAYAQREPQGAAFGYSESQDTVYYNPYNPDFWRLDFAVANTHELAHRIDGFFINSRNSAEFHDAILNAKKVIDADPNKFMEFAKKHDTDGFLSDIFSALSDDAYEFYAGHSVEYWQESGNKEHEIFANLFSLEAYQDQEKLDFIKEHFPEIYEVYKNFEY